MNANKRKFSLIKEKPLVCNVQKTPAQNIGVYYRVIAFYF